MDILFEVGVILALLVANVLPFFWTDKRSWFSRVTLLQACAAAILLVFGVWWRSGDFRASGDVFPLWGGNTVTAAFGGEYRYEVYDDFRPPFAGLNPVTWQPAGLVYYG